MSGDFSSRAYWEARYGAGGTSGAGSHGRLARFKASFLNRFVVTNGVRSVADFGCGDGAQLALLDMPRYTGVDVSPTALARCAAGARHLPDAAFLNFETARETLRAELGLSLDVIYHLIEDPVFERYMRALFGCAGRFVIVYSSNADLSWPSPHVRHRRFTDYVVQRFRDWRLLAYIPNRHPFDPANPDHTSFADFYVFGRGGEGCAIFIPE